MMINRKNCSLIVLLVLVTLPKNSKSIFPRLSKRSTDDGACEQSTAAFCSKVITDENGLIQRFSPDTAKQIQNHFENATTNCKVLLCVMTMYTVLTEGKNYFPNSPFINDDAFVNAIKGSSLAECNNTRDAYNTNDSQTEDTYKSTTDYESYTTDGKRSNTDFNQFETTSAQQDTQSIISNEIDGSLTDSKRAPRKGIIDILYTNENYTDATKSEDMNEQSDTKSVENYPEVDIVTVANLDNVEMNGRDSSTPLFIYDSGENEPSELDVANRLGVTEDTASTTSEFVFVSSFATSTVIPLDSTDVKLDGVTSSTGSLEDATKFNYLSNDHENGGIDETKRVSTSDPSAMPTTTTSKSAISQVGNVIFQLLGEEGYNSFSCNFTTASEDGTNGDDVEGNTMYRRMNKKFQSDETVNGTMEEIEFEPVDSDTLPEIPKSIRNDKKIKYLLLEFKIFELCNFTSKDHENISAKLTLCSNGITKLILRVVDGRTKIILEKYSQDILKAAKKFKVIQESKMKIVKIINLTDYLASTIKESDIPKDLKSKFQDLKRFLLVELKNEDLSSFHPDSNRKDVFMAQLFDYLMQSNIVDIKTKKLLEVFKKFIRNGS